MRLAGIIGVLLSGAALCAQEPDLRRALADLPPAPAPKPQALVDDDLKDAQAFAPGIRLLPGKGVVFAAEVLIDRGPTDGLEVMACLPGGKNHESYLLLDCPRGDLAKAALIAAFDIPDGEVAYEAGALPARGQPVLLSLRWQPDPLLEPDLTLEANLATLVRDRIADAAYPPLPWIYTGSRMESFTVPGQAGQMPRTVERFALESTRSVVVNFNEPDALLAHPSPLAAFDDHTEVNTALRLPPRGSRVQFVIRPCPPLPSIQVQSDGSLLGAGQVLDQQGLDQELARLTQAWDERSLRVIALQLPKGLAREVDLTLRQRVLESAARIGVWLLPIFVPSADGGA